MSSRSRMKLSLSAVVLCLAAGLLAAFFGLNSASAASQAAPAKTTTVAVTAGKPSELAFKLAKTSLIPAGKVIFNVKNSGKIPHTFEICLTTSANANANKCKGKGMVTPMIQPGKTASITVTLTKTGTYEFLCTVPGHASAGMKGLVGIGVKVPAVETTPTTSTTATTTAATTTTATTTAATTTTTAVPPPTTTTTGGTSTNADGCPPGQTIVSLAADDHDDDDSGSPSDGDGCV